jgi:hypothetical protein
VLTALDLFDADLHRPLIESGLLSYPPPEVDCLEAKAVLLAKLPELGEDVAIMGVPIDSDGDTDLEELNEEPVDYSKIHGRPRASRRLNWEGAYQ